MDNAAVRNSRILSTFDEILHASVGGPEVVEIVGRGIAAAARCTLAVLADKSRKYSDSPEVAIQRALAYSDELINLGVIEDDLVEVWRHRSTGDTDDVAFASRLNDIVLRLANWPQRVNDGAVG